MVATVRMPKLGLTMTKGTIISWAKKEGDRVQKGEKLAVIETEKVSAEINAPSDGFLLKILSPARSSARVGDVVAFVGEMGETLPQNLPSAQSTSSVTSTAHITATDQSNVTSADRTISGATPKAKRLAKDRNVDLSQVKGTGPLGMISEQDVLLYLEQAKGMTKNSGLKVKEAMPLSAIRRTIAERMTASLQTTAQVSIIYEVDASEITAARGHPGTDSEVSYTVILVKLLARALREFPIMNSELEDDEIKLLGEINIGVAVATDEGLMVPVIRNADLKSLGEIAAAVKDLAERARSNRLALEDVTGGTFTITNLGMTAVDAFTPIINPPQVAILGVGRIAMKPVARATAVEVRPRMNLSLTFDHRVVDGYTAGTFMAKLAELIEKPELLAAVLGRSPPK